MAKKNTPTNVTQVMTPVTSVTLNEAQKALLRLKDEVKAREIEIENQAKEAAKKLSDFSDTLPGIYGCSSLVEVISMLKKHNKTKNGATATTGAGRKRSISDATRAKVVELSMARKTGNEIKAELGISIPSIQAIRLAAGLVRVRQKVAA
jgi:hypothetical protein